MQASDHRRRDRGGGQTPSLPNVLVVAGVAEGQDDVGPLRGKIRPGTDGAPPPETDAAGHEHAKAQGA